MSIPKIIHYCWFGGGTDVYKRQVYEGLPRRREGFRWVIDNVHDTLCFNCGRRETCWKQEYTCLLYTSYLVLCVVWGLVVITGGNLNVLNDTVMHSSLYYKAFNVFNPCLLYTSRCV